MGGTPEKADFLRKLREIVGVKAGSMGRYGIVCADAEHLGYDARAVLPQAISFSGKFLVECVMR